MNELVIIFIIFILVISFFMHYEERFSDLTYVKSELDNKEYLVRNREDSKLAANLLAQIKSNLEKLVNYLKNNNSKDERIQRLVEKFNPENISESIAGSDYTSYSVNKGEKIVFCIRSKDDKQELEDINTMMFVAIHELAHIMTKSIGHTDEFWENMRYLLEKAIKLGIYNKIDYKSNPRTYCGVKITDSPLQ
jgi:predicted metal-dependent hydrolase